MGSFGDDDDTMISSFELDISDTETERMDSQSSSLVLDGYGSFDNTVPVEDVETQAVCLAGETPVLNFDGETQAVDNLDCAEDLCTQLFDDCDTQVVGDTDDEGTRKTEVLSDTEELSDVDSVKKLDSHPVEQEKILQTVLQKQNCGPVLGGFTSLRVASIRSSGLAARNMSLKRTNNTSCSNVSDSQHEAGHSGTGVIRDSFNFVEQIDQSHNLEEHDDQIKGSSSENKCRVGKSAVRKLFSEDISHEKRLDKHMINTDNEAKFPPVCISENELAGLSYVDSQEPGEASQTIALDVVDRFLKVNVTEYDQEAEIIKSTGGKLKPYSGAKGTQSLAKRANRICSASGGIFDWDDNQEDEGGGEFFRKKKEAFTQPRDSKRLNLKNCWAVKANCDKVEQQDITNSVADLIYSDSKLLLHKPKKNDKTMKVAGKSIGKNLIKELNDSRDGMVETGTKKDNADMLEVGVDTQLAAEAMEALCNGVGLTDHNSEVDNQDAEIHLPSSAKGKLQKKSLSDQIFVHKKASCTLGSGLTTRQFNQTKRSAPGLTKGSSILSEHHSTKTRKQCDKTEDLCNLRCELIEESMNEKKFGKCGIGETERCLVAASSGLKTVKKGRAQEQLGTYSPIACRTRQKASNQTQRDTNTSTISRQGIDNLSAPKRKRSRTASSRLAREKYTEFKFILPGDPKETKITHIEQSYLKISGTSKVRNGKARLKLSEEEINGKSNTKVKFSKMKSGIKRKLRSSGVCDPALPSLDRQSRKGLAENTSEDRNPIDHKGSATSKDLAVFKAQIAELTVGKSHSAIADAEEAEGNSGSKASRKDICTPKLSAFMTPMQCTTLMNETSPICMGNEYHKQSCRKNLLGSSLKKEVSGIIADGPESSYAYKDLRKKRDIAQVQVLFSQHLDGDVIKQQKKVLSRLGASVASSISDATHFVTDKFVRTRNMLESIAYGKPVVTHFWLESCGHASCLIDERDYILRDAKKEKEISFSLPVSLARACQHPLLQGCRVLITRNTKPGKDILASLVKAVHGMAVERIGRSALKDERIPGDLIVLSCEEDYADCVPFLEKGVPVYSSELLLNGIVIQKLEYERHRLFC